MRIKNILISICIAITTLSMNAQSNISDEGVEVNGITWATSNVGATNPEDYGNLYTWDEAQNACPAGWVLPTIEAFMKLAETNSEWITINGKNGHKFGSGNDTLFLPATGMHGTNGSVSSVGSYGLYWGYLAPRPSYMYFLILDSNGVSPAELNTLFFKMSVRCVKR